MVEMGSRAVAFTAPKIYHHSVFPPIPNPTVLQWVASEVKIFASCQNGITTPTREWT